MELRHLRHFIAVIEHGSFSKAALMAHITQPALTRSIKSLEDLLGTALVERRPRGIAATPAGLALYQQALFILNATKRAREDVRAAAALETTGVTIGVAAMFAGFLVDQAVAKIAQALPSVALTITSGFYEDLVAKLVAGDLDVVFCNLPGDTPLPQDLAVEAIYRSTVALVAAPDHPLAKARNLTRATLAGARWAVVDQPHMRDYLDRYFAAAGLRLNQPAVKTNSLSLIRALLKRGPFVALLPTHLVRDALAKRELRRLADPEGPILRDAGLIWRKDAPLRPAARMFIDQMRTLCAADKTHKF